MFVDIALTFKIAFKKVTTKSLELEASVTLIIATMNNEKKEYFKYKGAVNVDLNLDVNKEISQSLLFYPSATF